MRRYRRCGHCRLAENHPLHVGTAPSGERCTFIDEDAQCKLKGCGKAAKDGIHRRSALFGGHRFRAKVGWL